MTPHRVFPCFDQPDLKATYDVKVRAPSSWKLVSNAPERDSHVEGEWRTVKFERTQPFSTYLVFLGAGDFDVIAAEKPVSHHGREIPMRLFVRKSVRRDLDKDVEEIFDIVERGFRFFGEYFDYPYPFDKYDQIFVPLIGFSAMENVGAVTLTERFIYRGPQPVSVRDGRASTILHELAHMWFGNLVTMAWWNDLWLNESFATYMAALAQDLVMKNPRAWLNFHGTKGWAYWQDQLVTTHAIETSVNNTNEAFSNFDGITYGKGAASIKQLAYFTGAENFRDGLRAYFEKHAWGNSTRPDFTGAIGEAAAIDLRIWSEKWLQTAGLNRVKPIVECKGNDLHSLGLRQTPSVSNTLSPHRTAVALFTWNDGKLELGHRQSVVLEDQEVFTDPAFKPCPDLFYANYGDNDYALYSLDPRSLEFVESHLNQVSEPLLRAMLWGNVVPDGAGPGTEGRRLSRYRAAAFAGGDESERLEFINRKLGRSAPRVCRLPRQIQAFRTCPYTRRPGLVSGIEHSDRVRHETPVVRFPGKNNAFRSG